MTTSTIPKLVVIGLGLIGGSLAAGLKSRRCNFDVVAVVRNQQTVDVALANNIVDRALLSFDDIAIDLDEGDIIFIAVPTLSMPAMIQYIKERVSPKVTITDGASVKSSVVDAVNEIYGYVPSQFVPGHPIAGSEKSGVAAADPDLYVNHRVILTPLKGTGDIHLQRVTALWNSVEADVLIMSIEEHDAVLAATSHLPHAIAYCLVDTLVNDFANDNIFRCAAGGFRDCTRIATSDPQMWHDIMCANRQAVLDAIDLFQNNLSHLRQLIAEEDSDALLETFHRAKIARDKFSLVPDQQFEK